MKQSCKQERSEVTIMINKITTVKFKITITFYIFSTLSQKWASIQIPSSNVSPCFFQYCYCRKLRKLSCRRSWLFELFYTFENLLGCEEEQLEINKYVSLYPKYFCNREKTTVKLNNLSQGEMGGKLSEQERVGRPMLCQRLIKRDTQ